MPTPSELRTSLPVFAEAIGLPLAPWQADALTLAKRLTTITAPRQSGKSRALSALALWWSFREPGMRTLLVSAGEDASKDVLDRCARAAADSPLLGASVIDDLSAELTFTNGSSIRSVPTSEARIRGQSIDLLLIDEAAQVDPQLLLGAALPTTSARPRARVVLAGSPLAPEGPFHDFVRAGEQGEEHVAAFHWRLTDATWIEASVIDAARAALPAAMFEREFEGLFSDAGLDERVIARAWIEEAQQRSLDPGRLALGCDVARRGADSSVVVAMRGEMARVIYSTLGADTMALAAKLAHLSREEAGPPPMLAVDEIGVGGPVIDRLVEMGVPVTGYNASHRAPDSGRYLNTRSSSWWDLRERFPLGEIDLDPADRELADQLAAVTYSLDGSGRIVLGDKSKMAKSPDRADALVIAAWAQGERERGEQVKALLAEQAAAARTYHQPELAETALRGPSTEEAWSRPRERVIDSDLPVLW